MIEDTNSAEIVSDPYRRTQQDKEMDKAHFLLDLKTRTLIRNSRTHIILRQSTRGHFRSKIIINESQILTKEILSSDLSRASPIISDVNR